MGKTNSSAIYLPKIFQGCILFLNVSTKKRQHEAACHIDITELVDTSALKIILSQAVKKETDIVKKVKNSMLEQVNVAKDKCRQCTAELLELANKNVIYMYACYNKIHKDDKDYHQNNIVITKEKAILLCGNTLDQSQCKKWYDARRIRVSANKDAHNIKCRIKKTVDSLVSDILYPKKFTPPAVRYGKEFEFRAVKAYEELYHTSITKVGVLVSVTQPWLCASLDGLVYQSDKTWKCVEVKCPITCKKFQS